MISTSAYKPFKYLLDVYGRSVFAMRISEYNIGEASTISAGSLRDLELFRGRGKYIHTYIHTFIEAYIHIHAKICTCACMYAYTVHLLFLVIDKPAYVNPYNCFCIHTYIHIQVLCKGLSPIRPFSQVNAPRSFLLFLDSKDDSKIVFLKYLKVAISMSFLPYLYMIVM